MLIKTPHGEFDITRKNCVAFSVVKTKRSIRFQKKLTGIGSLVFISHNKKPTHRHKIQLGWCDYIASYDLSGNEILLKD